MTEQQISCLVALHTGEWFGFEGKQAYKNLWVAEGYDKPTLEEIDQAVSDTEKAQKEREARDEARVIAINELVEERMNTVYDNVKNEIALGKVEDARKAVREEHKKLKSL